MCEGRRRVEEEEREEEEKEEELEEEEWKIMRVFTFIEYVIVDLVLASIYDF